MTKTVQFWSNPYMLRQITLANREAHHQMNAFLATNNNKINRVVGRSLNLYTYNHGRIVKATAILEYEPK